MTDDNADNGAFSLAERTAGQLGLTASGNTLDDGEPANASPGADVLRVREGEHGPSHDCDPGPYPSEVGAEYTCPDCGQLWRVMHPADVTSFSAVGYTPPEGSVTWVAVDPEAQARARRQPPPAPTPEHGEPALTVAVHPLDDPTDPGARRYLLTDDTDWGAVEPRPWDLVTGNAHPEAQGMHHLSLSTARLAGWPRQSLSDLARVLGHADARAHAEEIEALTASAQAALDDEQARYAPPVRVEARRDDLAEDEADPCVEDYRGRCQTAGHDHIRPVDESAEHEPADAAETREGCE